MPIKYSLSQSNGSFVRPVGGQFPIGLNVITAVGASYVEFTSSPAPGTYTIPTGLTQVKVIVVAGGGGGGRNLAGAGGGGGVYYNDNYPVTPGAAVTVTVGAGGAGGVSVGDGSQGGTSQFGALISYGGYGGTGGDGGAGGTSGVTNNPLQPVASYGWGGRGGGPTSNADANDATHGGAGYVTTSITGSQQIFSAGGGGGGAQNYPSVSGYGRNGQAGNPIAGRGGAAISGTSPGANGSANKGGGGGGGGYQSGNGGSGGSGYVGISYAAYGSAYSIN